MKRIAKLIFDNCKPVEQEMKEWRTLFLDILKSYEYFNLTDENGMKEPKFKIDRKSYLKVVQNTISDVLLIILRYGVISEDCQDFKGISKNKFLGSFIYHFMRILPANNSDRKTNAYIILFILSFVKDDTKSLDCGMSDDLKKEFFFFLTDRQTSSENIYFFLQALCHKNSGTEIKITHNHKN